jgi:hypothetical protein
VAVPCCPLGCGNCLRWSKIASTEPEASTQHCVVHETTVLVSDAGAAAAAAASAAQLPAAAADVVAEDELVRAPDAAPEKFLCGHLQGCASASSSPPLLRVCLPNIRRMSRHQC